MKSIYGDNMLDEDDAKEKKVEPQQPVNQPQTKAPQTRQSAFKEKQAKSPPIKTPEGKAEVITGADKQQAVQSPDTGSKIIQVKEVEVKKAKVKETEIEDAKAPTLSDEAAPILIMKAVDIIAGKKPQSVLKLLDQNGMGGGTFSRQWLNGETGQDIRACNVSLEIRRGETTALIGSADCGKADILRAMDGIAPVVRGEVLVSAYKKQGRAQIDISTMRKNSSALKNIRRMHISLMQIDEPLLNWRNIGENVALALECANVPRHEQTELVLNVLKRFGLNNRSGGKVEDLTPFEADKVKLARAMVRPCDVLLLENPFDKFSAHQQKGVFEILKQWQDDSGAAIVMTLDNQNLLHEFMDHKIFIEDGKIVPHLSGYENVIDPILAAEATTKTVINDKEKQALEMKMRKALEAKLKPEIKAELRSKYTQDVQSQVEAKVSAIMRTKEKEMQDKAKLEAAKYETASPQQNRVIEDKIRKTLAAKSEADFAAKVSAKEKMLAKDLERVKAELQATKTKLTKVQQSKSSVTPVTDAVNNTKPSSSSISRSADTVQQDPLRKLTAKDVMEPQQLEIENNPIRYGKTALQMGRFGIVKPNVPLKDLVKISLQTGLPILVEDKAEKQIIGVIERDQLLEALLQ
jgi:glycine betaine/proline transport system ATP-binding protein